MATILTLSRKKKKTDGGAEIIFQADHPLANTKNFNSNALKVLNGLTKAGFEAYLVGGCVRDLLLGLVPKDFDVVTNAHPEEVRQVFRSSILIGRRFRLAHVRFGREVIEVATFRSTGENVVGKYHCSEEGMLLRDNIYGTMYEDVWRRDFTINALYYRVNDCTVIDYTKGMQDLKSKKIRIIGDPVVRYREDPVRMLRALRLAAKLDFTLAPATAAPITKLASLFTMIAPARLFEEVNKWFRSGKSLAIFNLLQKYKIFPYLFAQTAALLRKRSSHVTHILFEEAFARSDQRISSGKPINPAFLYAVLLWPCVMQESVSLRKHKYSGESAILHRALQLVLQRQKRQILFPQKIVATIRDIWQLQYHFTHKTKRRVSYLLAHPKFRAAYDFLELRMLVEESLQPEVEWWRNFQEVGEHKRRHMIDNYR